VRSSLPLFLAYLTIGCALHAASPTPVEEFSRRAKEYADLQKDLRSKLPKLKDKSQPEQITGHQKALQTALRDARKTASQGDIFIPAIREHIQTLLNSELKGARNKPARDAVKESNPRGGEEASPKPVPLAINAVYPKEAPLTSVPPSVLLKLPKLPEELEYRFVGKNLILRDTMANIIVDYLPGVAP
jgi:hypothetical protein